MVVSDTTFTVVIRSTMVVSADTVKDLIQQRHEVREITKDKVEFPWARGVKPPVIGDDLPEVRALVILANDLEKVNVGQARVVRAAAEAMRKLTSQLLNIIEG